MLPTRKNQNWLPGIFNDFFGNEWVAKSNSTAPAMNIIETDKQYKVEIASPGMTKDDFKIKIDSDNHLVISMEKKTETKEEDKDKRYLRRDFSYSHFKQTLILPDNVDKDTIYASQDNGVLVVVVPKKETTPAKDTKDIEVK